MFLAGHPPQGCFGLQSHCAPCYFFNQASFYPSDFSFIEQLWTRLKDESTQCKEIVEQNNLGVFSMGLKVHSVKPVIGAWPVMPMRRTDVKLTRLRIGHTRFTHRHLLLGENAPECPS
ncbi:RNase H domain-containing protein [Trichonephila clavipes]|nr:RNase H domain-containing protein [Trichonephila clavipes]